MEKLLKRWITLLLLFLLLPGLAMGESGYADYVVTRTLRSNLCNTSTRVMDVPTRGPMIYYAQTNPIWERLRYEAAGSKTFRRFGDAGCCPTSAAIAFANLLTTEELAAIRPYASKRVVGFGITTASMNPRNAATRDGVYWFDHAEDYFNYLPLVFGQYAAGNNRAGYSWRAKPREANVSAGGTGSGFVPELAKCYGITCTKVPGKDNMDFLDMVRCGATAVALANTRWQPFATGLGHYVTIVAADDDSIYIMDPQDKTDYSASDRWNTLEVLESGLVRVKLENFHDCQISMMYVLSTPEIDADIAAYAAMVE